MKLPGLFRQMGVVAGLIYSAMETLIGIIVGIRAALLSCLSAGLVSLGNLVRCRP